MEPFSPTDRQALRAAHPDLRIEEILHLEGLLALRFSLDPESQAESIGEVDRQIAAFIAERIPDFKEVLRSGRERPMPPDAEP